MFTGLIEDVGVVRSVRPSGDNLQLCVETSIPLDEIAIGDSIAVDGFCQTVVSKQDRRFCVDVGSETMAVTTVNEFKPGRRVNLERAMRLGDRLGGHLVAGHVDAVGIVARISAGKDFTIVGVEASSPIVNQCISKGSIAVDGISLTINRLTDSGLEVGVIPHTLDHTTLVDKRVGDRVNLETDMIGKYVRRFLEAATNDDIKTRDRTRSAAGISLEDLAKAGFLE